MKIARYYNWNNERCIGQVHDIKLVSNKEFVVTKTGQRGEYVGEQFWLQEGQVTWVLYGLFQ